MIDVNLLGCWVRRFLLEHLAGERNLARNTQRSQHKTDGAENSPPINAIRV